MIEKPDFFISKIGDNFKVNQYLRNFVKQTNDGSLTYGDLVDGWYSYNSNKESTIGEQFQYNQFQRDFFSSEKERNLSECRKAWQLVRSVPGEATYKHYLQLTHS